MTEVETRPPRPLWFWILLFLLALIAGWFAWQVLSEADDVRDAPPSTVRAEGAAAVATRSAHAQLAWVSDIDP